MKFFISKVILLFWLISLFLSSNGLLKGHENDILTRDYTKDEESIKDTLKAGEFIRDSTSSRDKRTNIYLIFKSENGGSNYSCLIITGDRYGLVKDNRREFSLEEMKKKNSLFFSIIELGDFDDAASSFEARIGFKTSEKAPYKITYIWKMMHP